MDGDGDVPCPAVIRSRLGTWSDHELIRRYPVSQPELTRWRRERRRRQPWRRIDDAEAQRLLDSGTSALAVSRALGCASSAVYRAIRDGRLQRGRRDAAIRAALAAGGSAEDAAAEWGVSARRVRQVRGGGR